MTRLSHWLLWTVGGLLLTYHMVTLWVSLHGAMKHYTIHLTAVLILGALLILKNYSGEKSLSKTIDLVASLISLVLATGAGVFLYTNAETLEITQPFVTDEALIAGACLITAVVLITWRMWGATIAFVCLISAAYMTFGHLLPESLASRQQPLNVAISFLSGIGGPRGVLNYMPLSADMIFLLLVYGGLLHGTRVIDTFGELGQAIGLIVKGGVAYSAVVASTLIGMVTGQAISNIALSGVMTIPTMKKNGFTANEAGAIEVMASTGSQLLPPIMGLGAFLMAVILGVSYIEVVIAGLIPGLLYMFAIGIALYSLVGHKPRAASEKYTINWHKIGWTLPSFILSFIVLITLLVLRYSPAMAGFWGGSLVVLLSFFRPAEYRPNIKELLQGCLTGLETAIQLTVVLAAIGLVVQTLTTTGLGVSAGHLISVYTDGNIIIALMIGMAVSLVVGMGLPTPAAYALIAIIVVPGLIDAGLSPMAANMYGFYFAIFSALTPPVAVGILVAARISGGSFMGSALEAAKLGSCALLVPFVFVSIPSVLDPANMTATAAFGLVVFLCASVLTAGVIYGAIGQPLSARERCIYGLTGPLPLILYLLTHNVWVGLIPIITIMVRVLLMRRKKVASAVN
ncbi:TRAP transporter fused permease subunit [Marinomonas sp. 5E14-1]|uniref:TRAP transporter permease n=1 Tax=Marinomonas sp. 5E14-1 TaxID=3153922 RepID=UPI003263689B